MTNSVLKVFLVMMSQAVLLNGICKPRSAAIKMIFFFTANMVVQIHIFSELQLLDKKQNKKKNSNCFFTKRAYQPITRRQLNAFRYADVLRQLAEV